MDFPAINHKGCTARVEFDERDNIFVGRVLGLRAMISFHGETVTELHQAFHAAVDDFLLDCQERVSNPRSASYETNRRKAQQN